MLFRSILDQGGTEEHPKINRNMKLAKKKQSRRWKIEKTCFFERSDFCRVFVSASMPGSIGRRPEIAALRSPGPCKRPLMLAARAGDDDSLFQASRQAGLIRPRMLQTWAANGGPRSEPENHNLSKKVKNQHFFDFPIFHFFSDFPFFRKSEQIPKQL